MVRTASPFLDIRIAPKAVGAAILWGSIGTLSTITIPSLLIAGPAAIMLAAFLTFFVVPLWAVGVLFVGYPAWMLAHVAGFRGWLSASLLGGVLAGGGAILFSICVLGVGGPPGATDGWENGQQTIRDGAYTAEGRSREDASLLFLLAMGAVGGICAGTALWRVAYGPEAQR
ncbi:MAG: hypothetical protein ACOVQ6_13275 [Brevundimonas sp.]|jgi:hypothetical protein